MKNAAVALLGVAALGLIASSGAMAGKTGERLELKKQECVRQANDRNFGVHEYQQHRFVIRCVANLPDLDKHDQEG